MGSDEQIDEDQGEGEGPDFTDTQLDMLQESSFIDETMIEGLEGDLDKERGSEMGSEAGDAEEMKEGSVANMSQSGSNPNLTMDAMDPSDANVLS